MRLPRRLAALAAAAALALTACGATCRDIARDRQDFLQRRPAPTPDPHAQVVVPFALADRLLADRVAALPAIPLPLLALAVPGLQRAAATLRLSSVRLTPAPDGRVGFALALALSADGRPLA